MAMFGLRVPIVCTVIAEGGSGGALAIGVGDRLLMLENAIYAVARPKPAPRSSGATSPRRRRPPRPCASPPPTAWASASSTTFVPEPTPAHEAPREVIAATGEHIARALDEVMASWDLTTGAGVEAMLEGALPEVPWRWAPGAMAAWRRWPRRNGNRDL